MKVTCPRCGEPGYMTRVKVYGRHYARIEHVKRGEKKRICYLGRDVIELRKFFEQYMSKKVPKKIIRYVGADSRIINILLPRIESLCSKPKCTLVEVFGGSGYVSQMANREKFNVVVYNDINDMLVAIYKHVKENPELLTQLVMLLPYSRSLHRIVLGLLRSNLDFASIITAATAFYAINTTFNSNISSKSAGFSYGIEKNAAERYRSNAMSILKYADVWKDITIENLDFRDVIKKYDAERTVFYLDPPYVDRAEEYYGTPFTVDDLREMATMLTQIRGRFLLKLDYKTYEPIKDILSDDKYNVEVMERPKHMQKVRGGQRGKWLLTLVSTKL
jgi:DNA adenine methylase